MTFSLKQFGKLLQTSLKVRLWSTHFVIILLIGLGINLIFQNDAYAASQTFQETLKTWGNMLALIGSMINLLTWMVLQFITTLLSNDFIFGQGMEQMLLSIWQTVRNWVNLSFVFVLLATALYNIVSVDSEKFQIKQTLGKIAIALIFVNFSFFAGKVILDFANVLTTAAFSIPRDILAENGQDESDSLLKSICKKKIYVDQETSGGTEADFTSKGYSIMTEKGSGRKFVEAGVNCYIPSLIRYKLFDKSGASEDEVAQVDFKNVEVLLYIDKTPSVSTDNFENGEPTDNMIDINALEDKLKKGQINVADFNTAIEPGRLKDSDFNKNNIALIVAKSLLDLNNITRISASSDGFLGLTVSGMMNIIVLVMYFIMFLSLFIILIVRVVYIWLCMAFSPVIALIYVFKDFGFEISFDIQSEFTKFAFAPAKIGLALSVGVLMIGKTSQIFVGDGGAVGADATVSEKTATFDIPIHTLFSGEMSLQRLMWNIATVVVIWAAIKWALKDAGGPASSIVDTLTGYVDTIGGLAAKAPLALPIAPFAGMEGGTIGSVLQNFNPVQWERALDTKIYGVDRTKEADYLRDLKNISHSEPEKSKEVLSKISQDIPYMQRLRSEKKMRDAYVDALKRSKLFAGQDDTKVESAEDFDALVTKLAGGTRAQVFQEVFGKNNGEDYRHALNGTIPPVKKPESHDDSEVLKSKTADTNKQPEAKKDESSEAKPDSKESHAEPAQSKAQATESRSAH